MNPPPRLDLRGRVKAAGARVQAWVDRRRSETVGMDLAVTLYERDRELFASVLGAAIALRLFLFLVPAVMVLVALLTVIFGQWPLETAVDQAGVTGQMARDMIGATQAPRSTWLVLLISALWLTTWAGRNLAKVLATCSGAAWQMGASARRSSLRVQATVTLLAFVLLITVGVTNRLRNEFGLAGATSSSLIAMAGFSLAWFAVMWALPRRTPDPGAILPGAGVVGLSLAGVQWFMQYYLPSRVERATAVAGGMGTVTAALGTMFIIGRVMASSFVVNAVVFERVGSISEWFFGLPVIRWLPRRFPKLVRWFDLPGPDGTPSPRSGP